MSCKVRIEHPSIGAALLKSSDISDTGIFLIAEEPLGLKVGQVVKGQVQGMLEESPVLDMEVMRLETDGIGLRFCDEER